MLYGLFLGKLPREENDLLDILSTVDPDRIPVELFEHFGHAKEHNVRGNLGTSDSACTTLSNILTANDTLQRAIQSLSVKSLLEDTKQKLAIARTPGRAEPVVDTRHSSECRAELRVHRMTQLMTRHRLAQHPEQQRQAFANAAFCICKSFPQQQLGGSMVPLYPACAKFTDHLLALLYYYEQNKDAALPVNDAFAETLAHCGWYFFEIGETGPACRVLHAAKSICSGPSQTSGLTNNNLGAVYMLRRKEKIALEYTERAIADRKAFIPENVPEIEQLAISYMNYANDLQLVQPVDRDKCAGYYTRALEIVEKRLSNTPHNPQLVLCNTAFAYYRWGELDRALDFIKKATALNKECGLDTTFILYGLYYYGNIQRARGERQEGYVIHVDCLERRQKLQTNAHYTTGVSLHKTGRLEYELGRPEKAIEYLQAAEKTFLDDTDDRGLWPRTCILLGRVMMEVGCRQDDRNMVVEGEGFKKGGLDAARIQKKDFGDGNDDTELESLVREVYR